MTRKVRIKIEYKDGRSKMQDFDDAYEAEKFFMEDAYITEDYVRKATWERV